MPPYLTLQNPDDYEKFYVTSYSSTNIAHVFSTRAYAIKDAQEMEKNVSLFIEIYTININLHMHCIFVNINFIYVYTNIYVHVCVLYSLHLAKQYIEI